MSQADLYSIMEIYVHKLGHPLGASYRDSHDTLASLLVDHCRPDIIKPCIFRAVPETESYLRWGIVLRFREVWKMKVNN